MNAAEKAAASAAAAGGAGSDWHLPSELSEQSLSKTKKITLRERARMTISMVTKVMYDC